MAQALSWGELISLCDESNVLASHIYLPTKVHTGNGMDTVTVRNLSLCMWECVIEEGQILGHNCQKHYLPSSIYPYSLVITNFNFHGKAHTPGWQWQNNAFALNIFTYWYKPIFMIVLLWLAVFALVPFYLLSYGKDPITHLLIYTPIGNTNLVMMREENRQLGFSGQNFLISWH